MYMACKYLDANAYIIAMHTYLTGHNYACKHMLFLHVPKGVSMHADTFWHMQQEYMLTCMSLATLH